MPMTWLQLDDLSFAIRQTLCNLSNAFLSLLPYSLGCMLQMLHGWCSRVNSHLHTYVSF